MKITAKSGKVKFRAANVTLTADKNKKVTLKLSKKARKAFKKKLRSGKKVKVKVTVTPALGARSARLTLNVRRDEPEATRHCSSPAPAAASGWRSRCAPHATARTSR